MPKEPLMLRFVVFLQNFLAEPLRRDDRGVTSVEYALMVVGVAVAIFAAVGILAGNIGIALGRVAGDLTGL
jgi:Flp pilus assembly pilin Flp